MSTTFDGPIPVRATDRSNLDRQLDDAVTIAMRRAIRSGQQGILVTRHRHDFFTVALSNEVPFGLTRERTAWSDDTGKARIGTH